MYNRGGKPNQQKRINTPLSFSAKPPPIKRIEVELEEKIEEQVDTPLPPIVDPTKTVIDYEGQFKVVVDKNRQLEEEILLLRTEIACKNAEEKHGIKTEKKLDKETELLFREREILEEKEIIRNQLKTLSTYSTNSEQQKKKQINPFHYEEDLEDFLSFFVEIKNHLLVLMKIDTTSSEEPSQTISSSPRTSRRIVHLSTPETPLSSSRHSPKSSEPRMKRLNLDVELQEQLNDGMWKSSNSLLRGLTSVLKWRKSPSILVSSLKEFLLPNYSDEILISVASIIYCASSRFQSVRTSCLQNPAIIHLLLLHSKREIPSLDIPTLRFFISLTTPVLNDEKTSLKPLVPLITEGVLMRKATNLNVTVRDLAYDLLELLLQRDSDANSIGFPRDEKSWDIIPSFFSEGDVKSVLRCTSLIAQHGEDAIRFLLHKGLIPFLINVLYEAEIKGNPNRACLSLLSTVFSSVQKLSLNLEEHHRLMASLLTLSNLRGVGDDLQTGSRAESILKSMTIE